MKKLRKPPIKSCLAQAYIDRRRDPEPDKFLEWIEGVPGLIFTLFLLVVFVAGMWGLWAIWQIVKPQ